MTNILSATCRWGYQCESNPINKLPRVLPPTSEVYLGKVGNKTILLRMLSSLLWHAIIDVVKWTPSHPSCLHGDSISWRAGFSMTTPPLRVDLSHAWKLGRCPGRRSRRCLWAWRIPCSLAAVGRLEGILKWWLGVKKVCLASCVWFWGWPVLIKNPCRNSQAHPTSGQLRIGSESAMYN
jgi:hypothetical protein